MNKLEERTASPTKVTTRDWYAWNNLMPPKPDDFHVVGEVLVGNPRIEAQLRMKEPQGINPQILLLDLILVQSPGGIVIEPVVWVPARFDKIMTPKAQLYTQVQIFYNGEQIALLDVENIK